MTQPQNPLTALLEAVAGEVERMAEALNEQQWNAFVETEDRTVGQLIHHIAWAWAAESAAFRALADGAERSGWTQEWLDAQNAEAARLSATLSRAEIMAAFRDARESAIAFIEGLSPVELHRSGDHMPGEPARTVAGWIEVCLIGHPREHLSEIETTLIDAKRGSP